MESAWLASEDPSAMLRWVELGRSAADDDYPPNYPHPLVAVSDRKLRLFATSCWRQYGGRHVGAWYEAIRQLEAVADGRRSAFDKAVKGYVCSTLDVAGMLRQVSALWLGGNIDHGQRVENSRRVAAALREVVGNPFRPAAADPVWTTATVVSLAESAYEDRRLECESCLGTGNDPHSDSRVESNRCLPCKGEGVTGVGTLDNDRLAVLSDALEEAGCDDADLLDHLRSPGPHVRGCWVLDLLLGKA
jgi:hypothetical protein